MSDEEQTRASEVCEDIISLSIKWLIVDLIYFIYFIVYWLIDRSIDCLVELFIHSFITYLFID